MQTKTGNFFTARTISVLAILIALVVLLQAGLGAIHIGETSFALSLIPIVLGAVLLGPLAGGILGGVFGLIVFLGGVTGVDPFTATLFQIHPILTFAICFFKGVAAGVASGWAYRLVARRQEYVAVFVAALTAPIVNTGLFLLGSLAVTDVLTNFLGAGETMVHFLFIGCAGINFLVEFAVNFILSPALYTVVRVVQRRAAGTRSAKKAGQ